MRYFQEILVYFQVSPRILFKIIYLTQNQLMKMIVSNNVVNDFSIIIIMLLGFLMFNMNLH